MTAIPGKETTTRGGDERETRPLSAPLLTFPLDDVAARLRDEEPYRGGDRNAVTLAKDGLMRVQLIALRRGARLQEDDPEGSLSILVVEGGATIIVEEASETLREGSIAAIAAGHRWQVSADEDALLLVQLSWPPQPASA